MNKWNSNDFVIRNFNGVYAGAHVTDKHTHTHTNSFKTTNQGLNFCYSAAKDSVDDGRAKVKRKKTKIFWEKLSSPFLQQKIFTFRFYCVIIFANLSPTNVWMQFEKGFFRLNLNLKFKLNTSKIWNDLENPNR